MNEEISALYKKEGVNPAGGCLPMLIQLPFLYRLLPDAQDRARPAPRPLAVDSRLVGGGTVSAALPIFMVGSMLIVSRMTPQPGIDPAQQKMMTLMMPLMMGFFFFRLPAGLNLYYAESNLIRMAQQAVMNRTSLGREMREMHGQARQEEREVAVSFWPLALSSWLTTAPISNSGKFCE